MLGTMLAGKLFRFLKSSPFRRLQWAVRTEGNTPFLWQEIRFIRTEPTQKRNRLDIIGPKGIGKSVLTSYLAYHFGEAGPKQKRVHAPIPTAWSEAFGIIISSLGQWLDSSKSSNDKKLRKMVLHGASLDLESRIMTQLAFNFAINPESLVRYQLGWFASAAVSRPEFVSTLLQDRLLLLCGAADPIERAIRGRKKRGDALPDTPQAQNSLRKQVQEIGHNVAILASIGIPVLTIDLDRPIRQNVAIVAAFLQDNHVTSRRIRKWAKRTK